MNGQYETEEPVETIGQPGEFPGLSESLGAVKLLNKSTVTDNIDLIEVKKHLDESENWPSLKRVKVVSQ